jgi:hypothetical protein
MKAPKILPWIAHRAGIDEQLALNLWRRAAGEAEEMCGCCNSSDYYRLALNRFIELADEEGEKCAKRDPLALITIIPSIGWMLREQNRFWQVNVLATQKACRFWISNLKYLFSGQKLVF